MNTSVSQYRQKCGARIFVLIRARLVRTGQKQTEGLYMGAMFETVVPLRLVIIFTDLEVKPATSNHKE